MAKTTRIDRRPGWHIGAAIGQWLVPGGGYLLLGEPRRAVAIGVSIILLWIGGLLIGGVGVCARDDHPAWFYAQSLMGPSWVVDRYQKRIKHDVSRFDDDTFEPSFGARFEPSYGHMNEQGILYTALAGLLNLLAIFDVIYRDPSRCGGADAA